MCIVYVFSGSLYPSTLRSFMNYEKVFITMHMIVKVYHKNAPYAINNLATHCSYQKRNKTVRRPYHAKEMDSRILRLPILSLTLLCCFLPGGSGIHILFPFQRYRDGILRVAAVILACGIDSLNASLKTFCIDGVKSHLTALSYGNIRYIQLIHRYFDIHSHGRKPEP